MSARTSEEGVQHGSLAFKHKLMKDLLYNHVILWFLINLKPFLPLSVVKKDFKVTVVMLKT